MAHGVDDHAIMSLLTLWRPLLPHGYSYLILCQTGLSLHL